jgi:glycosyltransferase involved in cell wall biosynthesis
MTQPHGTVLILCPGGLEHGGGIGRQMGYFLGGLQGRYPGLRYRVIDTRGPWFLGASPRYKAVSLLYVMRAAGAMLMARLSPSPAMVHVNITGRGSTIRKTILLCVARLAGLRYVLHIHDPSYAEDFRARGAIMRAAVTALFRGAHAVFVLGQHDQLLLEPLLGLRPRQTIVLPNAVPDPGPWRPKSGAASPCHLLFLGYLSARKGVPELLRALATPALLSAAWRLTLAGGGPIDEYRALAANLGLADRVEFPGWLDGPAVRSLCETADILCLPSHAEGLAMAVLEGLAHGLAIITTPVGAHAEAIEQDVSGLLVPPGDVAALAAALGRLILDNAVRHRLQAGARQRFLTKFDVVPYGDRLAALHAACLEEKRSFASAAYAAGDCAKASHKSFASFLQNRKPS